MVEGCVTTTWQEVQAQHLAHIGSRQNPRRWVERWIQHLWEVAWDQWDHRNDAVHTGEAAQHRSVELNETIRQEWEKGYEDLTVATKALFRINMEDLLQQTIPPSANMATLSATGMPGK